MTLNISAENVATLTCSIDDSVDLHENADSRSNQQTKKASCNPEEETQNTTSIDEELDDFILASIPIIFVTKKLILVSDYKFVQPINFPEIHSPPPKTV